MSPPTSFMRRLASRIFNLLTRALFGLRIADTQSGSKVFRRTSLAPVVDALEQSSWAFDVELLWSLVRRGCRILEVPIASVDRPGSKIDLRRTSWTMLVSVLRLRIQNSPLRRVRFLSRIGAGASVPVRSSHAVLVFGSDPAASAEVVAAMRAGGFAPVDARAAFAAWQPSLQGLGDGWLVRAFVFAWYVVASDRKYDAVVEIEGAKPWLVPGLSVKPSILVASRSPLPAWAISLYRRCVRVDSATDIIAAIGSLDTSLHKAVFVRDGQVNRLHYRDADSGIVESLTLR